MHRNKLFPTDPTQPNEVLSVQLREEAHPGDENQVRNLQNSGDHPTSQSQQVQQMWSRSHSSPW